MAERIVIEVSHVPNSRFMAAKYETDGSRKVIFSNADELAKQVELRIGSNSMVVFEDGISPETEQAFCARMLSVRDELSSSGIKFQKGQE